VRAVAAEADGWNAWGTTLAEFGTRADELRRVARREPFQCTWGGLVALGTDDAAAQAKAERTGADPQTIVGAPDRVAERLAAYVAAGADWVIVGPVDAANPENATILGEQVAPRLRADAG
jgi:alkanesulfonate monooxygenase SsuD/methylene tetrahydromethanopterin reductase-like flavin-dependent oxidoreductase (luciferase family)